MANVSYYAILSRAKVAGSNRPRKWIIEHEGEFFQEGCSYMATQWPDLDQVLALIEGLRAKWPTRLMVITKHDGWGFEEIEA